MCLSKIACFWPNRKSRTKKSRSFLSKVQELPHFFEFADTALIVAGSRLERMHYSSDPTAWVQAHHGEYTYCRPSQWINCVPVSRAGKVKGLAVREERSMYKILHTPSNRGTVGAFWNLFTGYICLFMSCFLFFFRISTDSKWPPRVWCKTLHFGLIAARWKRPSAITTPNCRALHRNQPLSLPARYSCMNRA